MSSAEHDRIAGNVAQWTLTNREHTDASAGFVAPIVLRIVAIAPSPSTTSAQVGPEVMKSTSSP